MLGAKLTAVPVQPAERIPVLDMLRGIALMGMIVANLYEVGEFDWAAFNSTGDRGVELFISGRFFTMFGILFGAGFALQMERAKRRGGRFVPLYLRRILGLFCFGIIADAVFGVNVLIEYTLCALLLLLVRNWSGKALVVLAFFVAVSWGLFYTVQPSVYAAVNGMEKTKVMKQKERDEAIAYWTTYHRMDSVAQQAPRFSTAAALHAKAVVHRYSRFSAVVFNWLQTPFLLFLLGFLAVRKGIFQNPKRFRRLITGFMVFGVVSWVLSTWRMPLVTLSVHYKYPAMPYAVGIFLDHLSYGFYLFSSNWLSFMYIGAVLLVASYAKELSRFSVFKSAGRMSMTVYMIQAIVISLLFARSGFGVGELPDSMRVVYALLLFGVLALLSHWWLSRYEYGPLEWIWRSATYWKWQPLRKPVAAPFGEGAGQEPLPAMVTVISPIAPSVSPEREPGL